MNLIRLISLTLLAAASLFAQPNITAVVNAASNRQSPLPGAELAQGSMVVFVGLNLGPDSFIVDSEFPLDTLWQDVSVAFTVGGTTTTGIIYYAGPTQVAAVMPSNTPTGSGMATLTYQSQTSAPFPIEVVASNIAIYSLNSSGAGPAVATFADRFVTPMDAAKPGDIVILWSNGLGPVTFDEKNAAPGGDMTEVPLEVFVGGKPAQVLYRGRDACCSSVDVVFIRIPSDIAGCATPVLMRIGARVSNSVTIPVAVSGASCTPTNPYLSQATVNRLLGQSSATFGTVNVTRTTVENPAAEFAGMVFPASTTVSDLGAGSFVRINAPPAQFLARIADIITFGSCTVESYKGSITPPYFGLPFESLEAGASLDFNGPAGSRTANRQQFENIVNYSGTFEEGYLVPGAYTANWTGGADVGPPSSPVSMAFPSHTIWTNRAAITTVNRGAGVTVEWTGGDPNGWVNIRGSSVAYEGQTPFNVVFTCVARTGAGSFTVPPEVLAALPPTTVGPSGVVAPGQLSLTSSTPPVEFLADGIDWGVAVVNSNTFTTVTYE